ncbi:lipase [Halioglobus sp. HI00S01]|uniref:esterase/lipase family protein n=1 Tax=Halioglobus sp. HI00S01 TaxID=1822214 RepID=UPI0007C3EE55|nr:triacylglycerol lipase [Halioglobus sp. HI00S01]KZX57051.1 lipase [Halioglobus sp. HI00S01]
MMKKTKSGEAGLKVVFAALLAVVVVSGSTVARSDNSGAVQYPIVLVHGLSGFDTLLFVDYFFGVENALSSVGANQVFTAQVTAFESNEVRGEQLLSYVQDVLALTGARKVNLIGHSQGGPTSRYVAAVRPDLVASVTSIGSPHYGSDVADLINGSPLSPAVSGIANALGGLISALSGDPQQTQNAMAALASLDSEGAAAFNATYPQGLRFGACKETPWVNVGRWWWPQWVKDYSVNDGAHEVAGVRYYSWGGTYNALANSNALDPIDAVLAITGLVHGAENDGLVERCSMHLGDNIRDDYTMNHLDQTNGLFGLRGLFTTSPLPLYKAHAVRLKAAGL